MRLLATRQLGSGDLGEQLTVSLPPHPLLPPPGHTDPSSLKTAQRPQFHLHH